MENIIGYNEGFENYPFTLPYPPVDINYLDWSVRALYPITVKKNWALVAEGGYGRTFEDFVEFADGRKNYSFNIRQQSLHDVMVKEMAQAKEFSSNGNTMIDGRSALVIERSTYINEDIDFITPVGPVLNTSRFTFASLRYRGANYLAEGVAITYEAFGILQNAREPRGTVHAHGQALQLQSSIGVRGHPFGPKARGLYLDGGLVFDAYDIDDLTNTLIVGATKARGESISYRLGLGVYTKLLPMTALDFSLRRTDAFTSSSDFPVATREILSRDYTLDIGMVQFF